MSRFCRRISVVVNVWNRREKKCFLILIVFCIVSLLSVSYHVTSVQQHYSGSVESSNLQSLSQTDFNRFVPEAVLEEKTIFFWQPRRAMAVFWVGGDLTDFLLKGFSVNNDGSFAAVCIGLTSSAILLEGLRKIRDHCYSKFVEQRKLQHAIKLRRMSSTRLRSRVVQNPSQLRTGVVDYGAAGDATDALTSLMRSPTDEGDEIEMGERRNVGDVKFWIPSCEKGTYRLLTILTLSTLLHMVYISIAYILMLAVMTFNVWVVVAIVTGIGIGRFFFGTDYAHEVIIEDDVPGSSGQTPTNGGDGPSPSSTTVTSLGGQESGSYSQTKISGSEDGGGDAGITFMAQRSAEITVHPVG